MHEGIDNTRRTLDAWYFASSPPPSPSKTSPNTISAAHWTARAQGLLQLADRKLKVEGSYDRSAQPHWIGVIGHHTNACYEWAPIGPDGEALVGGMTANAHAHVRRIKAGNSDVARPLICHFDQPTVVIGGSENYYHFVVDVLPRLLCVQFATLLDHGWQVAISNDRNGLMASAIALLGISDNQLLWLDHDADHWFSRAVYITNANIEGHLHPLNSLVLHRMKRAIPSAGNERLFISRAGIGRRRFLVEDNVVEGLEARGFTILCPERMRLMQQIAAFRSARIVVGVHGSGLTNLVWADRPQFLLELCGVKPSDEFGVPDLHFEVMTEAMNQCRYQRLRASIFETKRPGDHQSDFSLDCGIVMDAIDAALTTVV